MDPMRPASAAFVVAVLTVLSGAVACDALGFTPSPPVPDRDRRAEGEGESDPGEGEREGEGEGEGDPGEGEGEGEGEGDPGEGEGEGEPPTQCAVLTCEHGRCTRGADGQEMCLCDAGYAGNLNASACVPAAGTACAAVQCGALGTCVPGIFGGAGCECVEGAVPYGATCIDADKISCVDRDGHRASRGSIRCDATDAHLEVCHDGNGDGLMEWIFGAECVAGGSCAASCLGVICPDQPCPVGTVCVPEAHEQPLGVCVATCECNNCGNCSLSAGDNRWDDWQEHCGTAPNSGGPATSSCSLPCPNAGDGCIPYDQGICWPMEGCFSAAP